eukprot:2961149-Pyramimonas_sp.AAC.1
MKPGAPSRRTADTSYLVGICWSQPQAKAQAARGGPGHGPAELATERRASRPGQHSEAAAAVQLLLVELAG